MATQTIDVTPLSHPHELFIGGQWVAAADGGLITVTDSNDESAFLTVAKAEEADIARAVTAARTAFDEGPWPWMTHVERGGYLRALADALSRRNATIADGAARESGMLHSLAVASGPSFARRLNTYADLASEYTWEEQVRTTPGAGFSMLVREPVGVVGAIIPWNGPLGLAINKIAPALLAGCTTILKAAPEAPLTAYLLAECAEEIGLPPGVLNVVTADREASESLVRDPRVDKISFTGSTAAGRRIGAIMGERVARLTLELGGKSPAVILDDADIEAAAKSLAAAGCQLTGQVCASITRLIVTRARHDEFVDALAAEFSAIRVGNAFDAESQMGPLVSERQRERVESYIAKGEAEARLVTGGRRPADLDKGYFVAPTVFANVDNSAVIAREEIFGPVLSVIPAADEADAVRIANDTIYGLNACVFTPDADRALAVARRIRSGTVGHNAFRVDNEIAFGGFKQSGIGREGGREGLLPYLETKMVILDAPPARYLAGD